MICVAGGLPASSRKADAVSDYFNKVVGARKLRVACGARAAIAAYLICMAGSSFAADGAALIQAQSFQGAVPVTSWKAMRDRGIVKQDLDYSCGAASIATILNEFYGQDVTEKELLDTMDKGDMRASFDDMAKAVAEYGFRAVGYAASFDQLTKLKIPVIVYTKHRKDDHFSVLRGVSGDAVWLADPSLGNRTYSRYQFLDLWETRDDAMLKGKILAIVPEGKGLERVDTFFTSKPSRQTAQAVQQQVFLR